MVIMVRAASVSVAGRWELHVHHGLIWEIFWLVVVLWRSVGAIGNKVAVWEAVIMHAGMGEFLLVLVQLVHFRAYSCVGTSSAHLSAKNMSTLRGSPGLPASIERIDSVWAPRVDFMDHMHLIMPYYEFPISPISVRQPTYSSLYDLALRCYCWYFIVVFLYRRQINISSWNYRILVIRYYLIESVVDLTYRLGLWVYSSLPALARAILSSISIHRVGAELDTIYHMLLRHARMTWK